MPRQLPPSDDPRFHRRLLGSLEDYNPDRPPCLYYVENGNFVAGYDDLAMAYKMAADLIIAEQKASGLGNWTAPLVFMVRQTLELTLKALLEATGSRGNTVKPSILFSHQLRDLWTSSREWLEREGYRILNDQRFEVADWMITNFDAVDPSGDLFRFAHSKFSAFGRQKTYDRAGVNDAVFVPYFEATYSFLSHWNGVLVMEWIAEQQAAQGILYEPVIDPDGFPHIDATIRGAR